MVETKSEKLYSESLQHLQPISADQTELNFIMTMASAEGVKETKAFIKQVYGNSTWDRFGEYLEKMKSGKEIFIINRTFDIDIKKLFDAWSDPSHISKWLSPTGTTMEYLRADIRPEGSAFYKMTNGKDLTIYGHCNYTKIEPYNFIEYTQEFTDENENLSKHPMAPTWPATMNTQITFKEESQNRTRITIIWEPIGNVTPEELKTFIEGRSGMTMGWSGSFEKLESYLEVDSF